MYPENPVIQYLRTMSGKNSLFLVGGPVRDLLLGRASKDYDLMMEGDVFSLAVLLAERFDCKLTVNESLLTVSLDTAWGRLDIAGARREVYEYPGALPAVFPTTWQEDLKRRDFTVNTLAVPLSEEGWGEIVDLLGGLEDMENRLIRILHENSFRDDPTRLLRAIRLKNRLKFRYEGRTLSFLQRDWGYLERLSPVRRFKEWQLVCEEKERGNILDEIYHLGGWKAILGDIPYHAGITERLAVLAVPHRPEGFRRWFLDILLLLTQSPGSLPFISEYWGLSPKDREGLAAILSVNKELDNVKLLSERQVYRLLKGLPVEGVYYLFTEGFSSRFEWERFYEQALSARMPLQGRDLLKLGFEPGPRLGLLLQRLEDCYWKGEFESGKEGLILAQQLTKEDK